MPRRKRPNKGVRVPSQARSKRTVEAILRATTQVLTERGYAGTTSNHIARRAGVSVASFYEYFEDKDAAITAVTERVVDAAVLLIARETESVLGLPPLEALRKALETAISLAAANQALIRVLARQVPFVWELPKVEQLLSRLMELGKSYAGVQTFFPPEEITEERLYLIIIGLGSFIIQVGSDPKMTDRRKALVDEFVSMIALMLKGWEATQKVAGNPANAGIRPRKPAGKGQTPVREKKRRK